MVEFKDGIILYILTLFGFESEVFYLEKIDRCAPLCVLSQIAWFSVLPIKIVKYPVPKDQNLRQKNRAETYIATS